MQRVGEEGDAHLDVPSGAKQSCTAGYAKGTEQSCTDPGVLAACCPGSGAAATPHARSLGPYGAEWLL